MGLDINDSFMEITVKEGTGEDCLDDVVNAVADRIQISAKHSGAAGISICRGRSTETFVGDYCIREDDSGNTVGLFKRVNGNLEQIKLAIPGELALLQGSGISKPTVPVGWVIVEDVNLQQKYNIGTSPNWEVALIKYIGA